MKTTGAVIIENDRAWIMSMTGDKAGRLSPEQTFCVDAQDLFSPRPKDERIRKILKSTLTLAVGTERFYCAEPEFSFTDTRAVIQSASYKAEPFIPEPIDNLKCACLEPADARAVVVCAPADDFKDIEQAQDLHFAPWITAAVEGLIENRSAPEDFNFIVLLKNKTTLISVKNRKLTGMESFVPNKGQEERIKNFAAHRNGRIFVAAAEDTQIPACLSDAERIPDLRELILSGLCIYGLGREKIGFSWCTPTLPLSRQIYSGAKTSAVLIILASLLALAASFNINRETKKTTAATQKKLINIFKNVCGADTRMIDAERQIDIALETRLSGTATADCRIFAGIVRKIDSALSRCPGVETDSISINGRDIRINASAGSMQKAESLRTELAQEFNACRIDKIETQNARVTFSVSAKI